MTYFYSISNPNAYIPNTEAQRNYLARKTAKTDEVYKALRLNEDLRKLTGNLDLKEENQAYKKFIEINNLTDKYIPNCDIKFNDKEIRRKEINKKIYELSRYYNEK
ncbi:hypothetical protein [Anaerococcus hydrogenalis]|uniref:hypothetical protein n=1 Tax=Anaerococcus hydrogenalis TaxID=33029 RepID=UPI001D6FA8EA|nr:hypothetical protein [Anaerococcus hydrogenalis]MBS5989761.1 hypothetical protein [Anaerococcus hydrogenalis]